MFRGISPEGQCLKAHCFKRSLGFHELKRDAVRERLVCEPHLKRCILIDPCSVGVTSSQLASK